MSYSTSEKTFGQLLEKGRQLLAYIQNLTGYAPTEPDLQPAAFDAFLNSVAAANAQVDAAITSLRTARAERAELYEGADGLERRASQIRDYLASLPEGKKSSAFKQVQRLVQQITASPARKKKQTPEPGSKAPKEVSQFEVSFGSRLAKARQIEQVILATPNYTPSNTAITAAGFDALLDQIELKNAEVSAKVAIAGQKVDNRSEMYKGENGLLNRAMRIKAAIAAQFGRQSEAYKDAVRIKF
jgi:hypothetical protein